jgi:hypothetical protein
LAVCQKFLSLFIPLKGRKFSISGSYKEVLTIKTPLIMAIKPGPKPKKEDGTPDKRRRVTEENQPKHPGLKPHKHKPGE